jgi:predicted nuclease of restriction endonuclease-like (RecB) superfamily
VSSRIVSAIQKNPVSKNQNNNNNNNKQTKTNKQTNKQTNKKPKNNDFMKFAGKWLDLENIILSEVTQSQKTTHGIYSLISGY